MSTGSNRKRDVEVSKLLQKPYIFSAQTNKQKSDISISDASVLCGDRTLFFL